MSPDGNVKMYTTRCDEGQSWNGTSCSGTRPYLPWNHGGAGPLADWTQIGVVSATTGATNTPTIAAADASTNEGQQTHAAAARCQNLDVHGHEDWYLPATEELEILATNRSQIKGFGSNYWASTESNRTQAIANDFSGAGAGNTFPVAKNANYFVRCVRK